MPWTKFGSDIMLNIYKQRDMLYHIVYVRVDAEGEV